MRVHTWHVLYPLLLSLQVTEQLAEAMKHRDAMKGLADKLAVNMKKLSHERLKRLDKYVCWIDWHMF